MAFEGQSTVLSPVQGAGELPPPSPRRRRATLPTLRGGGGDTGEGGEVEEGSCRASGVSGSACGLRQRRCAHGQEKKVSRRCVRTQHLLRQ